MDKEKLKRLMALSDIDITRRDAGRFPQARPAAGVVFTTREPWHRRLGDRSGGKPIFLAAGNVAERDIPFLY